LAIVADPVGVLEIAERLGVSLRTAHIWLYRAAEYESMVPIPQPEYEQVNGSRAWEWHTILRWAGLTGHIHYGPSVDEYTRLFGEDPVPPRKGGRLSGAHVKAAKKASSKPKRKAKLAAK
jgi:hypothetical protein